MVLVVTNLPANAGDIEMRIQFLGQEDPLEEGMTTHSSIHAWRIPRIEEPGGLQSIGLQRVGHDWSDLACTVSYFIFSSPDVKMHIIYNCQLELHGSLST